MHATIYDGRGQMVIPAKVRKEAGIGQGDIVEVKPEGAVERAGDALGIIKRRASGGNELARSHRPRAKQDSTTSAAEPTAV
jgi:AbrB family looped-hinge helix DNA binding protein